MTNIKAGKFVDDETGESLNDVEKVLGELGIKLRENATDWREIDDVFSDIASQWDKWTDVEKNAVSTAVAGTRQVENVRALFSNYDRAMELAETSSNSAGLAMEKFGVFTEGLEAKINKLKATWDSIIYDEGMVNMFNQALDGAQALLEVFRLFSTEFTALFLGTGALFTTKKSIETFGKLSGVFNEISSAAYMASGGVIKFGNASNVATVATAKTSASVAALSSAMKFLAISVIALIVIRAMDELIVTQEELRESIQETESEYDSLSNTIQGLENELSNNIDRIRELTELLNSGDISIIEESELENLKLSNKLLEHQIELEKEKLALIEEQKKSQYEDLGKHYNDGTKTNLSIDNYNNLVNQQSQDTTGTGIINQLFNSPENIKNRLSNQKGELLTQAEDLLMLASAYDETTEAYKNYMNQYESIMITIDEHSFLTNKLSESINVLTEDQKWYLSYLSKSGELTQSEIDKYPDLISRMNEYGFSLSDISKELENIGINTDNAGIATESYLDIYDEFAARYTTFSSLVKAYNDENSFTNEQLRELITLYPALTDEVDLYLQGIITSQELFQKMQTLYNEDIQNYKDRVWKKRLLDEEYYNSTVDDIQKIVDEYLDGYEVDLSNAKSLAEAKLAINAEMFSKMGINAEKYYDAENSMFTQEYDNMMKSFGVAGSFIGQDMSNGFANQFEQEMNKYAETIEALKDISMEGVTFDKNDNMFGGFISSLDETLDSVVSSESEADDRLVDLVVEMLKHEIELKKEALEEELDNLEEAHDKKIELIEKERDAIIDAIEDEIQAYEDLINVKLDSIQDESDERDYTQELEERSKNISNLENQISALEKDDSADATKQRLELEEQLAEEKAELDDFQYEREKELREDSLNDELDRYTKEQEALIESENAKYDYKIEKLEEEFEITQKHYEDLIAELDDQLEKEGELRTKALDLIHNDTDNLYNRLIQWNSTYGSDSIETINEIWDAFWNYANNVTTSLDKIGKKATETASKLSNLSNIQDEVDSKQSYWEIYEDRFKEKYTNNSVPEYHDGGYVGGNWSKTLFSSLEDGLNSDEIFAKLQKGEFVATKKHQQTIADLLSMNNSNLGFENKSGFNFDNLMNIIVEGNLDQSVVPQLEKIANNIFKELNKSMSNRGVKRNAKMGVI